MRYVADTSQLLRLVISGQIGGSLAMAVVLAGTLGHARLAVACGVASAACFAVTVATTRLIEEPADEEPRPCP